ncbi:hypothetical protein HBDW_08400 [Herbaspirillum sp. DW155]|uniref:hypothetical protein n=1 Tax=Herbaspirillum sp. DW155 TaxID=3095609 RepID=UPI003089ED3C|nr:hypothetical protein HBDW_08400 [Herbaspirillum sp. DW155]
MFFDTVSHIVGASCPADAPRWRMPGSRSRRRQGTRNFDIVCDLFFIIPYRRAVIASA